MNQDELELHAAELAMEDYARHAGKIVLVSTVSGYIGSDTVEFDLETPVFARITPYASESAARDAVLHWTMTDCIDPYYDVEILSPHPELKDLRSTWTFGPARHTNGNVDRPGFLVPDDDLVARHAVESGDWSLPTMSVYEITLPGFDGESDETDDLVVWVASPDKASVAQILSTTGATLHSIVRTGLHDADYILPRDNDKLDKALIKADADYAADNAPTP